MPCWYEGRRGSGFTTVMPALIHWIRSYPQHWIIPTSAQPANNCPFKCPSCCFHNSNCFCHVCQNGILFHMIHMIISVAFSQVAAGLLCLINCAFGCYAAFKEVIWQYSFTHLKNNWPLMKIAYKSLIALQNLDLTWDSWRTIVLPGWLYRS